MTGFTMIDMVILIAYLGLVLLAGLHFSKKDMKGKEETQKICFILCHC